jgi:hypothetical protein
MMCHSLYFKRGWWDPEKPPPGEPSFIATYEVCFQRKDDVMIGSSTMIDKQYYSWFHRVRASWFAGPTHSYRGEFSDCEFSGDGATRKFHGKFQGISSSDQISFSFHMPKNWAQVGDALF